MDTFALKPIVNAIEIGFGFDKTAWLAVDPSSLVAGQTAHSSVACYSGTVFVRDRRVSRSIGRSMRT
jgi:hypothetical protein